MAQFEVGDRIGGEYSVMAVYGGQDKSGMGVVYLVQSRETPGPIVLKSIQHGLGASAKRRFYTEAKAWIDAGAHPNIVTAFWTREIAGHLFVAAEYVPPDDAGRNTLTQFIKSEPICNELILTWSAEFCYGMDYARSKGVVAHRDIKPDNLMIQDGTTLRITDFGLVKTTDPEDFGLGEQAAELGAPRNLTAASHTRTGYAMGTARYMAPEQFLNAKSADHRADIYSFGIIMYEMTTGGLYPYRLKSTRTLTFADYLHAHSSQMPERITSPLMPIIAKCLRKDPKQRYGTYDVLLSDLRAVAKSLGVTLSAPMLVARDDEELYAQAQSYVALGKPDKALQFIDQYVSRYPENACGWTEKGRIHQERSEFELALKATLRSLEINPYNTHAWNNLGIQLGRTNAPLEDICDAFEQALRLDPYNTAAMTNSVNPLLKHGQYKKAVDITLRALKLRPGKPSVLQCGPALLRELFRNRDFVTAETLLEAWTSVEPTYVDAWHNAGLIALDKQDLERAAECFAQVQSLTPEDNFSLLQLAKISFQRKKGRECIEHCNRLLERGHEPIIAIGMKARVVNFLVGYEQALNVIDPFLESYPEHDALWVILSEIHAYRDATDMAIKALKQAKSLVERQEGPHSTENLSIINAKLRQLSEREN